MNLLAADKIDAVYTAQRNIQILVSLLKQHGIRDVVLSPGSRNMGFVHSVEDDEHFRCFSVVDERSAAYVAIGISLETQSPVAISCTSAQATRNYIPAMTEAYYRGTPLVVINADYKLSAVGQGVMQAVDQMDLPRDTHKASVRLPVIRDESDVPYVTRLVNEALLEMNHCGSGPVHIDIETVDHWPGGVETLPVARKIDRYVRGDDLPALGRRKVLVVVGEHAPFSHEQKQALDAFSLANNCVVYTNHLSNYRGPRSVHASLFLDGMDNDTFRGIAPDVLITIGHQHGDYALQGKLSASNYEHWRVNLDGKIQDTYHKLTKVFELTEEEFFAALTPQSNNLAAAAFYSLWQQKLPARRVPDLPLSHAFVAQTLSRLIAPGASVHFGILSSLRNWNYFEIPADVACYSNVAAFGIDGCVSTFIGQTIVAKKKSFLIVGDLALFYDMNVLGNKHITNNARIVLVNNSGGGEFQLYSNAASKFGESSNRHIAAAGHFGSAQAWVESMGWSYIPVRSKSDLLESSGKLIEDGDRPVFMEVFTTMRDDSDAVKMLVAENASMSLRGKLIASLSPEAKRRIKKLLGRV
ncbi:2-succinyl-5-enolpyruvyl-6-hydroxy-3-cyclohexene-1-carboxylate synthase [Mycobacterium sp. THAF192]|nr:2-succinyl-5-enolpyruvyl-6-hydroxy-3-cyclohexene-1-carboxylate synthase [Mycobacterium sp. THAF192]